MTTDLLTLIGADIALKKTAGTNGGEYHGPCPLCGGRDRLAVWPNAPRPGWWCRSCGAGTDAIDYLRKVKGLSFRDACETIGRPLDQTEYVPVPPPPPDPCEPPCPLWQAEAQKLTAHTEATLWKPIGAKALDWLRARGFTDATIRVAGLGYLPSDEHNDRALWGIEGDARPLWLPRGIVIPWRIAGVLWKVTIRRPISGDDKYVTVSSSANALYNADALTVDRPAMLVEGVFDALAVQQAAGDLIAAVACGTTGARRVRWLTQLGRIREALVSLDADEAGDSHSAYWLEALAPHAKRWRPAFDDAGAMLAAGADVRGWVLAGLGKTPRALPLSGIPLDYWREELRLNSPALERLKRICQAAGYDYEATIERLR
jgi:DNA primase